MQSMARVQGEMKCVPINTEKYISFSPGNLRFIDSVNFLLSSLDSLVKGSYPQSFEMTEKTFKETTLLLKKGSYPYEYMDSLERFSEAKLPAFYSKLNGKGITEEDYQYAQKLWGAFACETLGNYHDLYLKIDVLLLLDVFENFRIRAGSGALLQLAEPGWDALLKNTGVQLELLTDQDMYLFIERGMRGGITMVSKCST